jgi:hypothetical protein
MDEHLATTTTRRTIVKTGAKLAYAAPLVAASFKLSAGRAGAQAVSRGNCPCLTLNCGTAVPGTICGCLESTEGHQFCSNDFGCGTTDPCDSTDDCPSGFFCQANSDCAGSCGAVCVPSCGTATGDAVADGAATNLGR